MVKGRGQLRLAFQSSTRTVTSRRISLVMRALPVRVDASRHKYSTVVRASIVVYICRRCHILHTTWIFEG